jgi:hypothetical protein
MSNLTLVYIAKDQAGLDFFSRHFRFHGAPQVDVEYIGWANDAGSPLSKIANEMLDRCKSPVFGLCHADAVFGPVRSMRSWPRPCAARYAASWGGPSRDSIASHIAQCEISGGMEKPACLAPAP